VIEAVDHVAALEARSDLSLDLTGYARRGPRAGGFGFGARHLLSERARRVVGGQHALERAERIERCGAEVDAVLAAPRYVLTAAESVAQHDGEVRSRELHKEALIVFVIELRDRSRQREQTVHTTRRITFDTELSSEDRSRIGERTAA
jgi:hypothetical protein